MKSLNIDGVIVDCWWGIVEGWSPQKYVWSGYRELFNVIREIKLKLQVYILIALTHTFLSSKRHAFVCILILTHVFVHVCVSIIVCGYGQRTNPFLWNNKCAFSDLDFCCKSCLLNGQNYGKK